MSVLNACINRQSDVALKLIAEKGPDTTFVNCYNCNALHYAVQNNMTEVALALLDIEEFNYDLSNDNKETAYDIASTNNMESVKKRIEQLREDNKWKKWRGKILGSDSEIKEALKRLNREPINTKELQTIVSTIRYDQMVQMDLDTVDTPY